MTHELIHAITPSLPTGQCMVLDFPGDVAQKAVSTVRCWATRFHRRVLRTTRPGLEHRACLAVQSYGMEYSIRRWPAKKERRFHKSVGFRRQTASTHSSAFHTFAFLTYTTKMSQYKRGSPYSDQPPPYRPVQQNDEPSSSNANTHTTLPHSLRSAVTLRSVMRVGRHGGLERGIKRAPVDNRNPYVAPLLSFYHSLRRLQYR